eukprot:CCRYP_015797-RA/>CCRYP_015797-RA protein AED:0.44 eAED:0.44 QI:0/-1/0/1/-1/1/1/0/406
MDEGWKVVSGKKCNKIKLTKSVEDYVFNNKTLNNHNSFAFSPPTSNPSADPPKRRSGKTKTMPTPPSKQHVRRILRLLNQQDNKFLDHCIDDVEQERTAMAKQDTTNKQRQAIETAHTTLRHQVPMMQQGRNATSSLRPAVSRALHQLIPHHKRVHFSTTRSVRLFHSHDKPTLITYDSGADGHYLSEKDRISAGLPILRNSSKRVGVANGGSSQAKHVTQLPFKNISSKALRADSFDDFPTSLMSVGKISDAGTVSIFTRAGVTVHNEQEVLITCTGEPILLGIRDEHGRYRIPLHQHQGQWQPRTPSKKARQTLRRTNSVYDLPSTEQAIKWMHAVCGYPVKSTWLKAVKAGNFIGWPLLTEKNVRKYYPETTKPQRDISTKQDKTSAPPKANIPWKSTSTNNA